MRHIKACLLAISIVSVAIFGGAKSALAEDIVFVLGNETGATLISFHVSHSGTRLWRENILGKEALASGYETEITIADGRSTCDYDFLSRFADGGEVEEYKIDLCDLREYVLERK